MVDVASLLSEISRFRRVRERMPRLLEEMQADVLNPEFQFVREFVVLPNRRVIFNNGGEQFFYYHEDEHENLLGQVQLLEGQGYVREEPHGNVAIYRFEEHFVDLLSGGGDMAIGDLLRDVVVLVKHGDGRRYEGVRAYVQPAQITTDRKDLPVEEGDLFERRLPSGGVERYTVLDAGYHQGLNDGEGFYLAKVRKQTKIEPTKPPAQIVYNISGTNARVNIQSVDTSMNLVAVEPTELFKKIRETIASAVPESRAPELLGRVDAMEAAQGTPDFMVRYREFIALAADHLTVLAPFLPALTEMLAR